MSENGLRDPQGRKALIMNIIITKKALIDYIPAQLTQGKDWMIYYYVRHPDTGEMKRVRIRINRIKSINERKRFAKKLINDINLKLASGFNPFLESDAPKAHHLLTDVLETYLREKFKETKYDTKRTYASYVKILKEWLISIKKQDIYAGIFNRHMAINYCSYLYNERNLGERSYNGHLAFLKSIFAWMKEHLYIRENPFENIKKKKTRPKTRVIINEAERKNLKEYLLENNYNEFYCIVLLAFHALIRPREITLLKQKYFDLDKGIITLPGSITKNSKQRISSLPGHVIKELKKIGIENIDKNYYVFGKNFKPSKSPLNPREISRFWANEVRLGALLTSNKQFYSLRDTGIIQLLKDGISPNEVMEQADHSSLEITSLYVKHANPEGIEKIKKQKSHF